MLFSKERNVEKVKTGRDEKLREIRNSIHAMQLKINEQFEIKLDALNGKMKSIQGCPEPERRQIFSTSGHPCKHKECSKSFDPSQ